MPIPPRRAVNAGARPWLGIGLGIICAWGATKADAACDFTVRFESRILPPNPGVELIIDPASIRIRSRASAGILAMGMVPVWGPWRQAQAGGLFPNRQRLRLAPGQHVSGTYRAAALCPDQREIRFISVCQSGMRAGSRRWVTASHPGSWQSGQRQWNVVMDSHNECNE